MNPKLHFQRFEFKYLITFDLELEIKKRIAPYIKKDSFVEKNKNGMYEVISLYYDSPGFFYYKEKIDGVLKRKKIRLRTYRNDGEFMKYSFFEIKRRHDTVILKDRFLMSRDDYDKLIKNDDFHSTVAIRDQNRKNIIKEFEWEQHLRSIGPKVLINYDREPYLGRYNDNFRITFDKNIKAVQNDNLFYEGNDFEDVSGNNTVMEVKFNGSLPHYVSEVIREFDLERISYSKYCKAIEASGSLSAYEFPQTKGIMDVREKMLNNGMVADGAFGI
ncbi:MAG: hypothetical protein A2725_00995 [Candidatus Magasanikbacteria bacterium RIFCSPHIGHO2_01_FULL_33_34]|uniref:VTC domain-containing protein n=1 Tax=Candidatus Magasanikbacteria bacterium RIFCSPHIGHO2_01_FULL_33_34 TaxID=1798671 RepID=A0A1F6LJ13_9BACT|nr:MAG: hypothetical protein A2725_00995 [Candidatus Magasanikbacteria bacterium RIFCSPHIGHO2_01_FULL_33_34]OGH65332.1 MAG: hypothetical protein A3B83_04655 [Candidatus Magasanikbacteria bacterium RIFCSPHIGHO2_02_FULL_33_17]OGH76108.1 MAG: hypothetical protein A3A89_01575 [Candidatus Magasanikbacteria bacterium RIFCSPLOWO2_01_FULL_33_34]OGH82509.1 MAG: hypothetical protein A3F93_00515 [Candidatus Magasanikbacteria bacterium RIFCSPLOWO2_12_FULL_34_7]